MNYQVVVYYTNTTDIRRYNADTIEKAIVSYKSAQTDIRFVRKVELTVLLATWTKPT